MKAWLKGGLISFAIFFIAILSLYIIYTQDNNPDLRKLNPGDKVTIITNLNKEFPEMGEQMLVAPCVVYNKTVKLTIFSSEKYWKIYDHSVQICYNESIDCKGKIKIEGILGKFSGLCWKGAADNEICNYYFINAEKLNCL